MRKQPKESLLLLALAALLPQPAAAQSRDETIERIVEQAATRHGVSPRMLVCMAARESDLEPTAVGGAGELGVFQLEPGAQLQVFYERGYNDPWDVDQSADFTAWAISQGDGPRWTSWRRCAP